MSRRAPSPTPPSVGEQFIGEIVGWAFFGLMMAAVLIEMLQW